MKEELRKAYDDHLTKELEIASGLLSDALLHADDGHQELCGWSLHMLSESVRRAQRNLRRRKTDWDGTGAY